MSDLPRIHWWSSGGIVSRRFFWTCGLLGAAGAVLLGYVFSARLAAAREFDRQARLAAAEAVRIQQQVVLSQQRKISAGMNFSGALDQLGLDAATSAAVTASAQTAFNLRHVRAGNLLSVGKSVFGALRSIQYQIDSDRMLWIEPREGGYRAEVREIPSRTEIVAVIGEIHDSLFNAVTDAGENPELAMRLAEIFGWDLDFYTDPRRGDAFRVVLEKKKYANGQTASYGRIFAAEYNNDGHPYQALLFHDAAGRPAYYAPDGKSLQKAFLRSPLKFAAPITSHFSRNRFHPVLKVHRPHLGIDYGAPVGTPVQSIGSGRVVFAGRKGGAGNLVQVQHANGYETMYLHLSRVLVRSGQRVEQGQRIGLVGMTGLATGPHLDFRILQNGKYRNFERLGLPPAEPVAKKFSAEFAAARDKWMPLLKEPQLLARAQAAESSGAAAADPLHTR